MRFSANESTLDRIVRVIAGIVLAALVVAGTLAGLLAGVASVVAALLLVTGAIGFCPLYAVLRVGTRRAAG